MKTRTTTVRVQDAQLRLMELIAERNGMSLAEAQRAAFSAYIEAQANADDEVLTARDKVAEEWKGEDEVRRREALQRTFGESVK